MSIDEIAAKLGVATSTVSRALSGKRGVSEKRRAEICALAQELGYSPDPHASRLRSGKGSGLTIITGFGPNAITAARTQALFEQAQSQFSAVRVLVRGSQESFDDVMRTAIQQSPEAIVSIIGGTLSEALQKRARDRNIAICGFDCVVGGADNLIVDRVTGMYQATRLLLLSGCQHPVFICVGIGEDDRMKGIRLGFESLGVGLGEQHLLRRSHGGPNAHAKGQEVVRELLESSPVDGLFCYSDDMAVGALRACCEAGIRVPEELKLVGFDNLAIAEYLPVKLTTVAQPVKKIAAEAIELCRMRMADPDRELVWRPFPTRLVVRESAPLAASLREQVFQLPEQS